MSKVFDKNMFIYDLAKWSGAPSAIVFLRLKKVYEGGKFPKGYDKGGYIISCNHTTFIDPIILTTALWKRRLNFIATKDFWEKKFLRWVFPRVGCIPIDKDSPSIATFREVKKRVTDGRPVGIFPEGAVSRDHELSTYKSGVVIMSAMANCDIMPVYIKKRKSIWERQVVVMGERFSIKSLVKGPLPTMEEIDTITKILQEKEAKLREIAEKY